MEAHSHGLRFSSYLSGNFHLDNYNTITTYRYLDNWVALDNVKGGLIMFPSQLLHEVSIYNDQYPRVSIAFDLHLTNLNDIEEGLLNTTARDFSTNDTTQN